MLDHLYISTSRFCIDSKQTTAEIKRNNLQSQSGWHRGCLIVFSI